MAWTMISPIVRFGIAGRRSETAMGILRGTRIAIITAAILAALSLPAAADGPVEFAGKTVAGATLRLTGILTTPAGDGRFAAVVMLHGCAGIRPKHATWAARIAGWGYVALQVDSLGPRGEWNICNRAQAVSASTRADDAHAAKAYLADLGFVDRARIAVAGWSHGGWSTLHAVGHDNPADQPRVEPFKAAVAFYPWCLARLIRLDAPLLILIGENDDWTPADRCQSMRLEGESRRQMTIKVFPGATHAFDVEGLDLSYLGHRLKYHPAAAAEAAVRFRDFLRIHLN